MNAKNNAQILSVFALICAIAFAPMSTMAFAQSNSISADSEVTLSVSSEIDSTNDETDQEQNDESRQDKVRDNVKQRIEAIKENRADRMQEFKDRMTDEYKDRVRDDISPEIRPFDAPPDRIADLRISGDAHGWTVVNGHAWKSTTSLDGQAWHIKGNIWTIHSKGTLTVADRTVDVELKGFVRGHSLTLYGTGYVGDDPIRVFIRGHYAPTVEYGVFAIAFNQMGVHNENTGTKLKMAQVGTVIVTPTGDKPIPEPLPYETPIEVFQ